MIFSAIIFVPNLIKDKRKLSKPDDDHYRPKHVVFLC